MGLRNIRMFLKPISRSGGLGGSICGVGKKATFIACIEQPEVIAKILTHLAPRPAPAHSPPFAGYPLPSAQQRVAPPEGVRSAQGTRDHAVGARGRRGPPGPAPGRPPFPLAALLLQRYIVRGLTLGAFK